MGVLDFLFEGKPPPSVTTYGNSTESIPKWLSDYTQGLVGRANAVAGEGYQTYGGPRIADFNQDQNRSMDLTRSSIGSYRPGMDLASSFEQQAADTSTLAAAQPYMGEAGKKFFEGYQDYMNPYTDSVIDKAKLDAENFYSDVITPALNKQFISGGQYGSSQHLREANREANKLTQNLNATALAERAKGFDTAGTLFGADANRQGVLAGLAGQFTGADAQIKGQAGRDLAAITQATNALERGDQAALSAVGDKQQAMDQANLDLAYSDFEGQRDYDREQVDWLNSVIKGIPYDRTTATSQKGPLGNQYQPSSASSILSALSAIKGMWGDGNSSWGDIWGDITGIFGGGGEGSADGGLIRRYRDGGAVKVKPLTDMIARLEAKRRPLTIDGDYEYVDETAYADEV